VGLYYYSVTVTDASKQPFPGAIPQARVRLARDVQGPDGTISARDIPIPLDFAGHGVVPLVAAIDMVPQTPYILIVEWFTTDSSGQRIPRGSSEWAFYARAGGGDIRTMSGVPESAIHVGPPWPEGTPPGLYLNTETGDIGWKDPS
jgi:hypothetical protein